MKYNHTGNTNDHHFLWFCSPSCFVFLPVEKNDAITKNTRNALIRKTCDWYVAINLWKKKNLFWNARRVPLEQELPGYNKIGFVEHPGQLIILHWKTFSVRCAFHAICLETDTHKYLPNWILSRIELRFRSFCKTRKILNPRPQMNVRIMICGWGWGKVRMIYETFFPEKWNAFWDCRYRSRSSPHPPHQEKKKNWDVGAKMVCLIFLDGGRGDDREWHLRLRMSSVKSV